MPTKQNLETDLINQVARFLKIRHRSRHEIEAFLRRQTKNTTAINATLAYFQDLGLIDDTQFANWFIESRLKKTKGPRLIAYELTHRFNLDPNLVNQTLSAVNTHQQIKSIKKYLRSQIQPSKISTNYQAKQKLFHRLYQRGFNSEIISRAIDEFILGE